GNMGRLEHERPLTDPAEPDDPQRTDTGGKAEPAGHGSGRPDKLPGQHVRCFRQTSPGELVGEPIEPPQRVFDGDRGDERTATTAPHDDARTSQGTERLADRAATHPEFRAELRLTRQAVPI